MTDLEEVPDDPTPLAYERLPDLAPAPRPEPEDQNATIAKVLHRVDAEPPGRRGGLHE